MNKDWIYGLMVGVVLAGLIMLVPRPQGWRGGGGGCCGLSVPTRAFSPNAVVVGNKICPVSGRPIGTMGPGVKDEYKGRIYHLCCGACIGAFESDPERYSKIAENEAASNKQLNKDRIA